MAVKHGRFAKAYSEGYDLSPFLKEVSNSGERDLADSSGLGDDDRTFVSGLRGGSMSLSGMFSARASAGSTALEIADVLSNALSTEGPTVFSHCPQGDSNGNHCYGIEGSLSNVPVSSPSGDLVSINGEITSDTGLERGVILHAKGAETSDSNGSSVDQTAAAALLQYGASAYLHVFTVGSGTLVVKVQHSADASTWADLITFASATAGEQAERKTIAEGVAINRYVRALWTITGSATFFLSFHRHLNTT